MEEIYKNLHEVWKKMIIAREVFHRSFSGRFSGISPDQ